MPATLPKPELAAYRASLQLSFPDLTSQLVKIIGKKLTAYVGGVKDVRAVERWTEGAEPYGEAEQRLRFAFQVVGALRDHDSPRVIQAWLTGINPELGDRTPIRLLREGDLDIVAPEVLGAARAFIAGG